MIKFADGEREGPGCVMHLLARLEQAVSDIAADRPSGPYLLEALLQDVWLCPAIGNGAVVTGGNGDDLAVRLTEARDAARVVLVCPVSTKQFAIRRLDDAVSAARRVLSRRVQEATDNGTTKPLHGERCATCTFA